MWFIQNTFWDECIHCISCTSLYPNTMLTSSQKAGRSDIMWTCLPKSDYWLSSNIKASIINLTIFFWPYNIWYLLEPIQISSLPCFFTHWTPTSNYKTKLFSQTYITGLARNLNTWKWKRLLCFSKEWTKDSHKQSLFSFH